MSIACRLFLGLVITAMLSSQFALAKGQSSARTIERTMARSVLDGVIAKGPQRLIATLRIEPYLIKGRFIGYLISGLTPDSPLLDGDGVRPGDIVLSVNQKPLERPEQFMRAWEAVGKAKVLEVVVLRGSEKIRYRWKLL